MHRALFGKNKIIVMGLPPAGELIVNTFNNQRTSAFPRLPFIDFSVVPLIGNMWKDSLEATFPGVMVILRH